MSTTVAPRVGEHGAGNRIAGWLKWVFSAPLIVAIVGAALTAIVVPAVTRQWQNHEKRLNIKTALAIDMSTSFTNAVAAGRRIGTGLVYSPTTDPKENRAVIQGEYNRGLGQWQVDRGRLAAQLFARYPRDLTGDWRSYARAIEEFYRLGAVIPGDVRSQLGNSLKSYFESLNRTDWAASLSLKRDDSIWDKLQNRPDAGYRRENPRRVYDHELRRFRSAYGILAERLLGVGDRFLERVLTVSPDV